MDKLTKSQKEYERKQYEQSTRIIQITIANAVKEISMMGVESEEFTQHLYSYAILMENFDKKKFSLTFD